jgi:hypothetical protein
MKKLILVYLLLAGSLWAQTPRQSNLVGQKVVGNAVASEYGKWSARVAIGNFATGANTLTIDQGSLQVPDGMTIQPISTSIPIQINDGPKTETVTPSSVNCSSGSGICNFTAIFANTHPNGLLLTSGTSGLQEALSDMAQSPTGGMVLVTPDWKGTTTQIQNAAGSTPVGVWDMRSGGVNFYAWNGSNYAIIWGANATGGLTPNTIASVSNINKIRFATQFSGSDEGAKITAAINDLPSTGGTVGAWFEGSQTWNACPFTGVTKLVTVILGAATITAGANCTVPANITLEFLDGAVLNANSHTVTLNSYTATDSLHFQSTVVFGALGNKFKPVHWGALCDGSTNDQVAFQAMTTSVNGSGGGHVTLPTGECYIGNTASTAIIQFTVGNISIDCPARLACTLSYTHTMSTVGPVLQFYNPAGFSSTKLSNIEASGFILNDRQTTQDGFNGNGLDIYGLFEELSFHDLKFLNIKGNASLTSIGANHVYIYNNWFTGTSGGGYAYSAGINSSGSFFWIWGNRFEGGINCSGIGPDPTSAYQYYWDNYFDETVCTTNGGAIGIGGSYTYVTNNTIYDHRSYNNAISGISFQSDANRALSNVIITGNTVDSPNNRNVLIANQAGSMSSPNWANIIITGNSFKGPFEIQADLTIDGQWEITNNTFDLSVDMPISNHRTPLAMGNTPITTTSLIQISGNTVYGYCRGGGAGLCPLDSGGGFLPMKMLDFTSWTNGKVRNLIIRNNRLGQTFFDSENGQIDGHAGVFNISVNANTTTANQTATVLGALVGDTVRFVDTDASGSANGLTYGGYVSSADTVTWWETNSSTSNYTGGNPHGIRIYVDRSN